jgi:anti-sigma regulatory factor (Ser/Thr protein kinase)
VPGVREFVREVLGQRSQQTLAAAELLASELATNCIRHANTDFEIAIRVGAEIRVEARDGEGDHRRPQPRSPSVDEPSGRGLRIIETMSASWGVSPSRDGKVVWFTLPAEPERSASTSRTSEARPTGEAGPLADSGCSRMSARRRFARPALAF